MQNRNQHLPWLEDAAVPALQAKIVGEINTLQRTYVYLHGAGANEDDLISLGSQLDKEGLHIALRAPIAYGDGWCWYPLNWTDAGLQVDQTVAPHSRDRIAHQLNHIFNTLGIDNGKVTVIGFSQGAAMALATAASNPGLFNEIVLLSGLRIQHILDHLPDTKGLPRTLVHHGNYDNVVPVAEGRALRDWCITHNPGGTEYQEFDMAHTITPESLADVVRWLQARPV